MKVTLLMALTADGMIARDSAHFPDWSGSEDKKFFKKVSLQAGVIIMGSTTYDTIKKPLPDRKNIVLTRRKERLLAQGNLVFTDRKPAEILNDLSQEGYEEAILIGGATINYLFASQGLIDEMILTYCPKIFGTGLPLISGEMDMDLELIRTQQLDENTFYAHYRVIKSI